MKYPISERLFSMFYRGLCIALLLGIGSHRLAAQYYTEHFDNVSALWSNGWEQQNRSVPLGSMPNWFQGDQGLFNAYDGGDTAYIAVNYNSVGGNNIISNWLFTPTRTFTNGERFSFWTRTVNNPAYADRLQVRLSLNGASTNVGTTALSVGDYTTLLLQVNPTLSAASYPHVWTKYSVLISGLSAPTAGRIAFRYFVTNGGPSGANSEYIGIDSVAYYLPPAGDLSMMSIRPMEYTMMPVRHPFPGPFIGRYQNFGSTTVNNATLRVNVYDGSGTQVYTASSAPHGSMAPGVIVTDSVAAPTGLSVGDYTVAYIALHSATDGNHSNDTLYDHFSISPLTYARDGGSVVGSIGIGAYVGGYVGQHFRMQQPDNLDSVWVHVTKGYNGRRIAAAIWDMASGTPNQIVGVTDTLSYTTDSAASYTLPLHGGPLQLPAGDFVVTMIEFDSTLNVGLASKVFTTGTTWLSWPTLPMVDWRNVEYFGLPAYNHAQMIRAILSTCDLTVAMLETPESSPGAHDGSVTAQPAGGTPPYSYAWSTGANTAGITGLGTSPVTVTVTDASGCTSTGFADLIVGIRQPMAAFDCGAYPNPNDGSFEVFLRTAQPSDVSLRILDPIGKLVWTDQAVAATEFQRTIRLQEHSAGIYFLQLQAADVVRTLKIVVRH